MQSRVKINDDNLGNCLLNQLLSVLGKLSP